MSFDLSRLAQQVVAPIQSYAQDNAQKEDVLGVVAQRAHVRPRAPPLVALDDSAAHLQFSAIALALASSPYAERHPRAAALNRDSETTSWQRVVLQVRERMTGPRRKHVEVIGEISVACAKTLQRMGRRRYPLYLSSATSAERSEPLRIIFSRRMNLNNWKLILPPREPRSVFERRLHPY